MLEFDLYRVQLFPDPQLALGFDPSSRPELLKRTVLSKPTFLTGRGQTWHIGNVVMLDNTAIYFRVGRTTRTTVEQYDEKDGDFIDTEEGNSASTHVFLDFTLGLCTIARKPALSAKTRTVANNLENLLTKSEVATEINATLEINAIPDPEEFISYIRTAKNITRFWYKVSLPNAVDRDADFVEPLQKALQAINGKQAAATYKGDGLDPKKVETATRSVAAIGGDAGMTIDTDSATRLPKYLKGSLVTLYADTVSSIQEKVSIWKQMVGRFKEIRYREEECSDDQQEGES